jgi:hypothetical protein
MCSKRFHIRAWGHSTAPDLDYESDVDDCAVYMQYPCVNVALQIAVSRSALELALREGDRAEI